MYPSYPIKEVEGVSVDKFNLSTLMGIWDKFSNILPLLPKSSKDKYPTWQFWNKQGRYYRQPPNRELAEQWQQKNIVSGWCVMCGDEDYRIYVVDLDPMKMDEQPETVYERIQEMSNTNFVLKTPSNGVHMYYRIPVDKELLPNTADKIAKGVDTRGTGGQVVFMGGINHYPNGKPKGVPDGHKATYEAVDLGIYDKVPFMSDTLYEYLTKDKKVLSPKDRHEVANNYAQTEAGQKRLKAHFNQPATEQERIVAEAVNACLKNWGGSRSYQEWYQVWMSAHHGCNGSPAIRDIFLTHNQVFWASEDDIQDFIKKWAEHERRDDGYTVASLFWLARQEGWMSKTGYEIDDSRMKHIDVRYISEWVNSLDTVPDRLLLQSQTGSGKTYTIKLLYERLGQPKTVIFVPTRKLATELAMTLKNDHDLPVTLYRDTDTDTVIETEELSTAQILVTTLQTFATKVDVPMEQYGLVYVEESNQLLAQFAKGGGGWHSSHVTDIQARKGYAKIREALNNSKVVWFVDATMTKVTQTVAEQMYSGHVEIVKNTRVTKKAPVTFLPDKGMAYQEVLLALLAGKRVVVCTDTQAEAQTIERVMEKVGALRDKKSIVIVKNTGNSRKVKNFMKDVNTEAQNYDLVCYNSVMASGVSITSLTPDVIVQIGIYLPPRVNLQILNRYRKQKQVYVHYMSRENLYASSAEKLSAQVQDRAMLESVLINMPIAKRLPDAQLRELVANISIADTQQQLRAPRDFYEDLLIEDGREVSSVERTEIIGKLEHTIDDVKEIQKTEKEYISATWREVPPVDEQRPAPLEYTALQVAQGETHAFIESALRGNIPDNVDDKVIYDIVDSFARYGFILTAFVKQQLALKRSEYYLADNGRSLLNLTNNVTLITLLAKMSILFEHSSAVLSNDDINERSDDFINAISLAKTSYDTVINPVAQKFDVVYAKNDNNSKRALAYARILLAKVGLKLRSKKVRIGDKTENHQHIANIEEARLFLKWRNADDEHFNPNLQFTNTPLTEAVESRASAYQTYNQLTEEQQAEVFSIVDNHNSFEVAVEVAKSGGSIVW